MGYLRFLLAITVTIEHLWMGQIPGPVAVFGFYCLSGFMMTKIICETYGNSMQGKIHFLLNRVIRIFPTYYLCLCIGLICITLVPEAHSINTALVIPKTLWEWLPQIFIFGLNPGGGALYPVRILPTGWSLNIELVYYVWMCLVIGSSFRKTLAWCATSLCVSVYLVWNGYPFMYHYFTFYNPSICFAGGAMLYHVRPFIKDIGKIGPRTSIFIGVLVTYIPFLYGFGIDRHPGYLYIAIPLYLYVIACLDKPRTGNNREQLAADTSYPLFLLHWPIAALFVPILKPRTFLFWAAAVSVSLLVSFLMVKMNNFIFLPIRRRIRNGASRKL